MAGADRLERVGIYMPNAKKMEKTEKEFYLSREKDKDAEIGRLIRDIRILERKVELYKEKAEKYDELNSEMEILTTRDRKRACEIQAITEIAGLAVDINHILKTKLAPLKYSVAIRSLQNDIVRESFAEIVATVYLWCDEMDYILNKSGDMKYAD